MDKDIVNFFKYIGFYDEEFFKLLEKKTIIINQPYEDIKELIGVFQNEDGTDFRVYLPKLTCLKDYLIHVHEYSHAMFLDDEEEIFPNLMEVYFIEKYIKNKQTIEEIINHTEKEIKLSYSDKHSIAKKIKINELLNYKNKLN